MNAVTLTSSFPATVQPGIPKLGEKPDGWTRAPLGQFLREVRRPLKMVDDQEYRLVTVKRARGGVVDRGRFFGRDVLVKSQFTIEPGDFLISKRQIVHGACGLVQEELGGSIVSNEYAVLNGNDEIDLNFLNYLAHSIFFQQTCFHSSIGVHVEKMIFKLDRWLKFEFDLPPLPEQQKIADILSTWDRAIETTEALLATARTQKRALMQALLTGKRRFPEFEGKAWNEVRLGEGMELQSGFAFKSSEFVESGVPIIRIANVESTIALDGAPHYAESNELIRFLVEDGDILISMTGYVGKIGVFQATPEIPTAYLNQRVGRVKVRPDGPLQRDYLLQLLQTEHFQREVENAAAGGAQPNVSSKDICAVKFAVPPLEEQAKVSKALEVADQEIRTLGLNVGKLRTEKKALMQQLLTGKRRVMVE